MNETPWLTPEERERYPEYEKYLQYCDDDSNAIGGFLEWLLGSRYSIYTDDSGYGQVRPVFKSIEQWICEYYGVDYKQAMKEKDECINALLEEIRTKREETTA